MKGTKRRHKHCVRIYVSESDTLKKTDKPHKKSKEQSAALVSHNCGYFNTFEHLYHLKLFND